METLAAAVFLVLTLALAAHDSTATPLYDAARNNDAAAIADLTAAGADPSAEKHGLTPLYVAASKGHVAAITALLAAGADPNVPASNQRVSGATPLHPAAGRGHVAAVTALLAAGANPNVPTSAQARSPGNTPLHWAAYTGHVAVVTALLDAGADPNVPATSVEFLSGTTPLHSAAYKGHVATVTALLDAGANPNAKNDIEWTPLHLAATRGHVAAVTALLEGGADPNAKDSHGDTPLDWVKKKPRLTKVRDALVAYRPLERAAQATIPGTAPVEPPPPPEVPLTASFSGAPAEHTGSGSFELQFRLSEEPVGLSYRTVQSGLFDVSGGTIGRAWRLQKGTNTGWGLRVEPAGFGDVTLTLRATTDCEVAPGVCTSDGRMLGGGLEARIAGPPTLSVADAEVDENSGATLDFEVTLKAWAGRHLYKALMGNRGLAAITALLDAGADPNAKDENGVTALHVATSYPEIVAALLDAGADPNAKTTKTGRMPGGWTPLHSAAREASDPYSPEESFERPIRPWQNAMERALAANSNSATVVTALLAAGADPNAKTTTRETPLHEAAKRVSPKAVAIVTTLLAAGADPNAKDERGRTPLHKAALSSRPKAVAIVAALLHAGADVNAKDERGRTPLQWAARSGSPATVAALLDAGAD